MIPVATKKKVALTYSEVVHLEGGKIKETWGYTNNLDMLAQLGLFQAPKVEKGKGEAIPDVPAPPDEPKKEEAAKDEPAKDEAKAEKKPKPKTTEAPKDDTAK